MQKRGKNACKGNAFSDNKGQMPGELETTVSWCCKLASTCLSSIWRIKIPNFVILACQTSELLHSVILSKTPNHTYQKYQFYSYPNGMLKLPAKNRNATTAEKTRKIHVKAYSLKDAFSDNKFKDTCPVNRKPPVRAAYILCYDSIYRIS